MMQRIAGGHHLGCQRQHLFGGRLLDSLTHAFTEIAAPELHVGSVLGQKNGHGFFILLGEQLHE